MFVKYNQAHYDRYNVINPILLVDMDESNEWLVGEKGENDTSINVENNLVFEDDDLTWGVVVSTAVVGNVQTCTRLQARSMTSLKGVLVDTTS